MKNKKLLFIISVVFFLLTGFTLNKRMAIEERSYKLILKEKNFEIRYYPKSIQASTILQSPKYSESANLGFRKLANYIFGGNHAAKKIAMTSPVEMVLDKNTSKMSFTMPSEHKFSELPTPNDPNIVIHESPEEYAASITFGGYASDSKIEENKKILTNILNQKNITTVGSFRYLGYNSPFKLFSRRNEIIISIDYNLKSKNFNDTGYTR